MPGQWLCRVGAGLLLVLLALWITDRILSGLPGEMETKAGRLRPGMRFTDAADILGEPSPGGGVESGEATLIWVGEDGRVILCVDHTGAVTYVEFSREGGKGSAGLLTRLRAWLGW